MIVKRLFYLFSAGMFIGSFYNPEVVTLVYTSIVFIFSAMCHVTDFFKPSMNYGSVTPVQAVTIKEYHIYLLQPILARFLAIGLMVFRWSAIVWSPYLWLEGLYGQSAILVVNFFASMNLNLKLDPERRMEELIADGEEQYKEKLLNIRNTIEAIGMQHIEEMEEEEEDA